MSWTSFQLKYSCITDGRLLKPIIKTTHSPRPRKGQLLRMGLDDRPLDGLASGASLASLRDAPDARDARVAHEPLAIEGVAS